MDGMLNLFDEPVVPGLTAKTEIVSPSEERSMIAAIDAEPLTPFQFQQWTGKRLTRSFGWSYDFQSGRLGRADPIPDWLLDVRERAAEFAGLEPDELIQALLIRYDEGAGIGWHRDRPIYEHVVGISLGATATLRLRRRVDDKWQRAALPLERRGVYRLSGQVRHDWEHSIAPMTERRHSITFRTFSESGRQRATT